MSAIVMGSLILSKLYWDSKNYPSSGALIAVALLAGGIWYWMEAR